MGRLDRQGGSDRHNNLRRSIRGNRHGLALVADLDGEQVADNAAVFIEHNRVKNPASDVSAYLADEK